MKKTGTLYKCSSEHLTCTQMEYKNSSSKPKTEFYYFAGLWLELVKCITTQTNYDITYS